jgi:hypothetical protein
VLSRVNDVSYQLGRESVCRLGHTSRHEGIEGVFIALGARIGDGPGVREIEVLGQWEGEVKLEALDEIHSAGDHHDRVHEVIEGGDLGSPSGYHNAIILCIEAHSSTITMLVTLGRMAGPGRNPQNTALSEVSWLA